MIRFHGVFIDETGHGEFGATIEAKSKAEAWEKAKEDYPESRCIQLESPEESAAREHETYMQVSRELDGDDYWGDDDDDDDARDDDDVGSDPDNGGYADDGVRDDKAEIIADEELFDVGDAGPKEPLPHT
jgi:hypothetical protein